MRVGLSCSPEFRENCFHFLVGRNFTAGYSRKRIVDRPELLPRRTVDTVPARLDFKSELRQFILIILGPVLDPRQYVSHFRIHEIPFSTFR